MSKKYDYSTIERPYDGNLERSGAGIIGDGESGAVVDTGNRLTPTIQESKITTPSTTIKPEITTGQSLNNLWLENWIKSRSYKPKTHGFYINAKEGYIECMQLYVGSGGIVGGKIDIPDVTSANSFHVESDGDTFWGCTPADFIADNDNANAYVLKSGTAKFQNVILEGSVILKDLQPGSIIAGQYIDALAVGKLTSGNITSQTITMVMSEGAGDVYIAGGTVNVAAWTADNGFILGIDDSDSNKEKFYIGSTSAYLDWNVTELNTLTIVGAALNINSGEANWFNDTNKRFSIETTTENVQLQLYNNDPAVINNLYITNDEVYSGQASNLGRSGNPWKVGYFKQVDITPTSANPANPALNIFRNLASSLTDSPVVKIVQSNINDDQPILYIQQVAAKQSIYINHDGNDEVIYINNAGNKQGIFVNQIGGGWGLYVNIDTVNAYGLMVINNKNYHSIYINQSSNSASTVYAMYVTHSNAGAGKPGGIDFSSFSDDEPIFNVQIDNTDPTEGGTAAANGQIAIEVGGGGPYYIPYYA